MTAHKSTRRAQARAAGIEPAVLPAATRLELVDQLHRMADEVAQLQSELAAVQALVTVTAVDAAPLRPGAGWQPSPAAQPWLDARSA